MKRKHDVLLGREILLINYTSSKVEAKKVGMPGVPSLTISVFVTFHVTQKSVRYRCRFLLENHGKKMRAKESASVPSKLDKILQNISESGSYEEEILGKPKDKQKDRQKAEEVRGMSLESLKEAKKNGKANKALPLSLRKVAENAETREVKQ